MLHPVSFMCIARHTNNSSKLLRKKVTHELKVQWICPYITVETDEEHKQNLWQVCKCLEATGLRVRSDKCKIMEDRIELLGFAIDKDGLHKSSSKVTAIVEASTPDDAKQILSLLGFINFYGRFLEHRADKLKSLYDCAICDEVTGCRTTSTTKLCSHQLTMVALSAPMTPEQVRAAWLHTHTHTRRIGSRGWVEPRERERERTSRATGEGGIRQREEVEPHGERCHGAN